MRIRFTTLGKTSFDFLKVGIAEYEKRMRKYVQFEHMEIKLKGNSKSISIEEVKEKEAKILLDHWNEKAYNILLDDKGKQFNSLEFSSFLEKKMSANCPMVNFICGGAYGFTKEIYTKSNEKISLSKMTFSHQIIRLIFMEQLYRACSILNNDPYHHE